MVFLVLHLSALPVSNYSNLTDGELLAFKKHNFEPRGFFEEKDLQSLKKWAKWLQQVDVDFAAQPRGEPVLINPMNWNKRQASSKTADDSDISALQSSQHKLSGYAQRAHQSALVKFVEAQKKELLASEELLKKERELTSEDIEAFKKHGYKLYGVFDSQTILEIKTLAKKLRVTAPSKDVTEIVPIKNGTWKRIKAQGFSFDQKLSLNRKNVIGSTSNNQPRMRSSEKNFSVDRVADSISAGLGSPAKKRSSSSAFIAQRVQRSH